MARVMKESGVALFERIPSGWSLDRLKSATRITLGKMLSPDKSERNAIDLPYVRAANLSDNSTIADADLKRMWFSLHEAKVLALRNGDVLVTEGGTIGQPLIVDRIKGNELVCFQNSINRLRSAENQRFLFYWLKFLFDSDYHENNINTVSIAHLTKEKLGEVPIFLPPRDEQRRISAWLDIQTGRIDKRLELLGKKRELLKTLRINLIADAIASGLCKQEAAQTGLPDLPEIPKNWKAIQAKRLLRFATSGSRGWAEYYADEGDIFLRIGNLTRETIDLDLEDLQYVLLPVDAAEGRRTRVRTGDMLVSITADIGSIAVAPALDKPAYVNQHIALCRPKDSVHPRWLGYAMVSSQAKRQMLSSGYGGTKVQLSLDDVRFVWLPVPPLAQQQEIADFLDGRLAKIARQIILIDQLEQLIKQQRKAIIHDAVTGKIDLSAYVPPQPQEAVAA